mmetsp:Transcript_77668/g.155560  ORF Transcript_77668/g.155560 Transcript_77668/m.155560 type:complete len:303 (+) Transcript_77668:284-1192(+)
MSRFVVISFFAILCAAQSTSVVVNGDGEFCSAVITDRLTTVLYELREEEMADPNSVRSLELTKNAELLAALATVAAAREEALDSQEKAQLEPGASASWFGPSKPSPAERRASIQSKLVLMPRSAGEAEKKGWKHVEKAYTSVKINNKKYVGTYTGIHDSEGNAAGGGSFNSSRSFFGTSVKCVHCEFADGAAIKVELFVTRQELYLELHGEEERGYYTGITDYQGRPSGEGAFIELHGIKWEGSWVEGSLTGSGKSFYSNGNMAYDGDWVAGKREGKGTAFMPTGKAAQQGRFEGDRFRGKA